MFGRNALILALIFLFVAAAMLVGIIPVGARDHAQYRALVRQSRPEEGDNVAYSGQQQRKGVQKDVWYIEGSQRLHFRITSSDSVVRFSQEGNDTVIIEDMNDVLCYMQVQLYYLLPDGQEAVQDERGMWILRQNKEDTVPTSIDITQPGVLPMQIIRIITADNASYHYVDGLFEAESVELARYAVPSHTLVDTIAGIKPLMTGVAQSVQFSLGGDGLNFKAQHLKATIFSPKGGLL